MKKVVLAKPHPKGNLGTILAHLEKESKGKAVNPWAVCTDSVGREDKDKYERCIQKVKQKQKIKHD